MQLNTDDCSSETLEYNLKISRPTEKMLEKQKRNKRKSKIFHQRKHTNSDEDLNSCSNLNTQNIFTQKNQEDDERNNSADETNKIMMFTLDKEECEDTPKKHNYTLELFQKLSVDDDLNEENIYNASSSERDNHPFLNQIKQILKDISVDREEKTTTSSEYGSLSQPQAGYHTSKTKTNFSEKFKSSCFKDNFASKRFKI